MTMSIDKGNCRTMFFVLLTFLLIPDLSPLCISYTIIDPACDTAEDSNGGTSCSYYLIIFGFLASVTLLLLLAC
ncbi:hypothetical protein DL96DRAFT_1651228 [Flagelloscypha sp. PMI_526]|nr:hypothetical protein DL96DRAFT_1651228 [Flagelloscypha sp. PMI_526]